MDNPALILINLTKSVKIGRKWAYVKLGSDELVNKGIPKTKIKLRSMMSCEWFQCDICRYGLAHTLVDAIYFGIEDANCRRRLLV